MAYRPFGGGDFFKFETPGQELEGYWRGTRDGKYGKNGSVETSDGIKVFSLNTAIQEMASLPNGIKVKLVYKGKVGGKNGQEYKSFEVFVDDSDIQPSLQPGPKTNNSNSADTAPPFEATDEDVPF